MPLLVNIRHLETRAIHLDGQIPIVELDMEGLDELMRPASPLRHELMVERQERGLLVTGRIEMHMACECARCLRPFELRVRLPDYCVLLLWEGEDAVRVRQDCVDLTPYLREDIVLALPQRPLCEPECGGFSGRPSPGAEAGDDTSGVNPPCPAWATLNKLKF